MTKPKTIKGLLSTLVRYADVVVYEIVDNKITPDEYRQIVAMIGSIQNDLGELNETLKKYGLSWPPE